MNDEQKRLLPIRLLIAYFFCCILMVIAIWLMECYPELRHNIHGFRKWTDLFVAVFCPIVMLTWCLSTVASFLVIPRAKKLWLLVPLLLQIFVLAAFVGFAMELNNSTSERLTQFCICISGLSTLVSLWPIKVLSKEIPRKGIQRLGCGELHGAPAGTHEANSVCKEDENADAISTPDSFIIIESEKEAVRKS